MKAIAVGASTRFASAEELIGKLREVSKARHVVLQAFNPDAVLSPRHIVFSFFQAFKAFETGRSFSRSLANEWLLRAAATRSMEEAIRKIGVIDPTRIVLGIAAKRPNAKSILAALGAEKSVFPKPTPKKISRIEKLFGVRAAACPLEELLLEKIALLELERSEPRRGSAPPQFQVPPDPPQSEPPARFQRGGKVKDEGGILPPFV
ncbi:MAG: KEOPS complex subunit Cgi121 [Candidatus Micrarchaeia archaeon]